MCPHHSKARLIADLRTTSDRCLGLQLEDYDAKWLSIATRRPEWNLEVVMTMMPWVFRKCSMIVEYLVFNLFDVNRHCSSTALFDIVVCLWSYECDHRDASPVKMSFSEFDSWCSVAFKVCSCAQSKFFWYIHMRHQCAARSAYIVSWAQPSKAHDIHEACLTELRFRLANFPLCVKSMTDLSKNHEVYTTSYSVSGCHRFLPFALLASCAGWSAVTDSLLKPACLNSVHRFVALNLREFSGLLWTNWGKGSTFSWC